MTIMKCAISQKALRFAPCVAEQVNRHITPAREYLRTEMVPALKMALRDTSAARAALLRKNGAWGTGARATGHGENVAMWPGDSGASVLSRSCRCLHI